MFLLVENKGEITRVNSHRETKFKSGAFALRMPQQPDMNRSGENQKYIFKKLVLFVS
jgi:hypothetical protein